MNILIADDEKPARGELLYMLKQLESAATCFEARTGHEALQRVSETPIDVAFLDINMPGGNGLTIAAALLDRAEPPLVVFATAYDAHAVRAFELAALDYLVKPFTEVRLAQTMLRIRQALAQREAREERQTAMRHYVQRALPPPGFTKLWGERENKTAVLVDYQEILWIAAEEKKVYLQTAAGEQLTLRYTLRELEERLAQHHIVRIHKAYLVNLDHVAEVVPWFSGAYQLRMTDAARTELPLSRQYAREFKRITGFE